MQEKLGSCVGGRKREEWQKEDVTEIFLFFPFFLGGLISRRGSRELLTYILHERWCNVHVLVHMMVEALLEIFLFLFFKLRHKMVFLFSWPFVP